MGLLSRASLVAPDPIHVIVNLQGTAQIVAKVEQQSALSV
jgi:hypothetical protein